MFFARPINAKQFHVFDDDNRSLCGRWVILSPNKDDCVDTKGNESVHNDDCKSCFKKMVKKSALRSGAEGKEKKEE
jgi:hypothetical protein